MKNSTGAKLSCGIPSHSTLCYVIAWTLLSDGGPSVDSVCFGAPHEVRQDFVNTDKSGSTVLLAHLASSLLLFHRCWLCPVVWGSPYSVLPPPLCFMNITHQYSSARLRLPQPASQRTQMIHVSEERGIMTSVRSGLFFLNKKPLLLHLRFYPKTVCQVI